MLSERDDDPLTRRIIECAIDVHAELGPGLLEQAYSQAMCAAFMDAKILILNFNRPRLVDGVKRVSR